MMATPVAPEAVNEAQARFNQTYITATEIAEEVGVSRPSVLRARERNLLPDPVFVGSDRYVCIWERDRVRPSIDAWKRVLSCRKGHTA